MAFLTQTSNAVSIKLDETNYPAWIFQMQHHLRGLGLLKYIDGSCTCPPQYIVGDDATMTDNSVARNKWMEQDSALISMLINTLSSEAFTLVTGCSSSMEVWMVLKQRYATISEAHIMDLKSELQSLHKGSDSIEKYLLKFKAIRDKLAVLGVKMVDQDVKVLILAGLPSEYNATRQIIRGKSNIDLEEVRSLLLSAERDAEIEQKNSPLFQLTALLSQTINNASTNAQKDSNSPIAQIAALLAQSVVGSISTINTNAASGPSSITGLISQPVSNVVTVENDNQNVQNAGFIANGGYRNGNNNGRNGNNNGGKFNGGSPIICQICEKSGHGAWKCHQRNNQSNDDSSSSSVECQICKKPSHIAKTCKFRNSNNNNNSAGNANANVNNNGNGNNNGNIAMFAKTAMFNNNSSGNAEGDGNGTNNENTAMTACSSSKSHEVWLVDSGATNHMTADLSNLQNVTSYCGQGDWKDFI